MTVFDRSEAIFDAMLCVAVRDAFDREMSALPDDDALILYQTPPSLDKRIAGLIKGGYRKIKARHYLKGFGKAAACLCIIITVAATVLLSVGATRNAIFNAIIKWHEQYTEIKFGDSSDSTRIYRPAYLPEGFKEKSVDIGSNFATIIYTDSAGVRIIFDQQKAGSGTTLVDNEHTDYVEVQVAGNTGHLFTAKTEKDSSILIWEAYGSVFELISTLDSGELIRIGESLKNS